MKKQGSEITRITSLLKMIFWKNVKAFHKFAGTADKAIKFSPCVTVFAYVYVIFVCGCVNYICMIYSCMYLCCSVFVLQFLDRMSLTDSEFRMFPYPFILVALV